VSRVRGLGRRLVRQDGYSLIEMLTVMIILGVVLSGLTTLFVQGSNAEMDMNNRFQAQQEARLALDKLRREAHCASEVSASSATSITLTLASYCPTGNGSVSWCTVLAAGSTNRYGLYRKTGAVCNSTGTRYADYLTTGNAFTYTAQSSTSLAKLHVDFPVNVKPKKSVESYELVDDIVLRNSTRS
jgi:prepilin-type N-terminal cleavage/methylation domain-containing protein